MQSRGGKVVVRTYRDGPSVVMEVADTGIGISPADQPKVYDRFFRVDRARSTESGGPGSACHSRRPSSTGTVGQSNSKANWASAARSSLSCRR
ncbi:MAG: hypothetical protein HND48_16115 [Chloroflexi bacterium]|nr:hypothetical protein [Chloroflexota bacterium]